MAGVSARQHAADLSYAGSAETRFGRAVIRLIENATGRPGLIRRAIGYEQDLAAGINFFNAMTDRFGVRADIVAGRLDHIPRSGPVIVIANHPFGILDGLILGQMLAQRRSDFRILANDVFQGAPDLDKALLPVCFERTGEALARNIATRQDALRYLDEGGAVGVFPGGTVSTGARVFSRPMDPGWRRFTARMIARSRAVVVPVYFEGHNSRIFQIASHVHLTLRLGLLIREFGNRVDQPVRVALGAPVGRDILDPLSKDSKGMMDFLRKATYELSPDPVKFLELGYEFEGRHRRRD